METTEGNKLIAEFMGFKPYKKHGFNTLYNEQTCEVIADLDTLNNTKDWDDLMPVVEKIEALNGGEFSVHINKFQVYINKAVDDGITTKMVVRNSCDAGKLEAVYKVVVEFIQWYNKNK